MLARPTACLSALTALAALAAAQQSSTLDRGDTQLTQTPGLIQNLNPPVIADVGFNQIDITSPADFAPAAGGGVATPRLVYALFPELGGTGGAQLRVRRSLDGGRSWQAPVVAYAADTQNGEDLNTGDEGTHILAWGDAVWVTFQTNRHDTSQDGQSLWVVASSDQGQTWSPPLNVSTGWSRGTGNRDWDVDDTRAAVGARGLCLCWEADFEDPLNPGSPNAAPNNNENLYFARVALQAGAPVIAVPETPLTSFPIGQSDVDTPSIDCQDDVVLVGWVDDARQGLAPGGNATLSAYSLDAGASWSAALVHSGQTPGTFVQQWAQPRRPWALVDLPFAYLVQEDSRTDEDDVWMDRADVDTVQGTVTWSATGVRCNHTSTTAGSGDVDGIVAAAAGGVLAILYRDDSAGVPLDNSNEAYLVVDDTFGFEFQAGTFARHTVTTTTSAIYDIEVAGSIVAGAYETCAFPEECGIVLSHDRGSTIEAVTFTTLGSCNGGTVDVDDCRLALSRNGDFNVIYADNRLGLPAPTNGDNVCWVTGGKYPRLSYDRATFTMTMDKVDPNQSATGTAFLMISGATTPGTDLNAYTGAGSPGRGNFVSLANDFLWNLLWSNLGPFLVAIDASGTATWPGVPNATALLGLPVHVAGGTLDFARLPGDPFLSYTDAIVQ